MTKMPERHVNQAVSRRRLSQPCARSPFFILACNALRPGEGTKPSQFPPHLLFLHSEGCEGEYAK